MFKQIAFLLVGALLATGFFVTFKKKCPNDGNPIGFRYQGQVQVDSKQNNFDLTNCESGKCTIKIDFTFWSSQPQPTVCETASPNCFHYSSADNKTTLDFSDHDGPHHVSGYSQGTVVIE